MDIDGRVCPNGNMVRTLILRGDPPGRTLFGCRWGFLWARGWLPQRWLPPTLPTSDILLGEVPVPLGLLLWAKLQRQKEWEPERQTQKEPTWDSPEALLRPTDTSSHPLSHGL